MNREDMLAALVGQAQSDGTDLITLRAIIEEASELGADRVLRRLGLEDEQAQSDIDSCATCSAPGARPRPALPRR